MGQHRAGLIAREAKVRPRQAGHRIFDPVFYVNLYIVYNNPNEFLGAYLFSLIIFYHHLL